VRDNPERHVGIEQAHIEAEQTNEGRDAFLPCLENQVHVPHIVVQLALHSVHVEFYPVPGLVNDVIEIVKTPQAVP